MTAAAPTPDPLTYVALLLDGRHAEAAAWVALLTEAEARDALAHVLSRTARWMTDAIGSEAVLESVRASLPSHVHQWVHHAGPGTTTARSCRQPGCDAR